MHAQLFILSLLLLYVATSVAFMLLYGLDFRYFCIYFARNRIKGFFLYFCLICIYKKFLKKNDNDLK